MTLPIFPNAISFADLETEFGGISGPPQPPATRMPIPLSNYYAGGLYVSAGNVGYPSGGAATTIPSSGAVSMASFHGASDVVTSSLNFRRFTLGGDPIEFIYYASEYYGADGQFTFQTNGSITILGTNYNDPAPDGPSGFCTPEATAGVGEDYQVRIAVTQGGTDGTFNGVSFQIGPPGSQVGVNPFGVYSAYYTISQNILINFANVGPFGEYNAYGDIDVRKISTGAVQTVSFYITLLDENP